MAGSSPRYGIPLAPPCDGATEVDTKSPRYAKKRFQITSFRGSFGALALRLRHYLGSPPDLLRVTVFEKRTFGADLLPPTAKYLTAITTTITYIYSYSIYYQPNCRACATIYTVQNLFYTPWYGVIQVWKACSQKSS